MAQTWLFHQKTIYLCSWAKKRRLIYPVEQHLRWLNPHICLELLNLPEKFNFFRELSRIIVGWWQVQSAVHVTTKSIWLELPHLTIFLSKHRLRYGSRAVIESNMSTISCGLLLILSFFFSKSVTWLYVPSEWHITTYRYFFAQERKKAFKLPSRAL